MAGTLKTATVFAQGLEEKWTETKWVFSPF